MAQTSVGALNATPNMYDLAVLLAEGQSSLEETSWEAFIDNLSRITDAFADARAKSDVEVTEHEELVTV